MLNQKLLSITVPSIQLGECFLARSPLIMRRRVEARNKQNIMPWKMCGIVSWDQFIFIDQQSAQRHRNWCGHTCTTLEMSGFALLRTAYGTRRAPPWASWAVGLHKRRNSLFIFSKHLKLYSSSLFCFRLISSSFSSGRSLMSSTSSLWKEFSSWLNLCNEG